jgi:uncharacterized protein (TIGR02246 family)
MLERSVLLTTAFVVSAFAYSPMALADEASDPEASKVAQSVIAKYIQAYDSHDPKAVSMLFVPGGVFLPPNGAPMAQGREAIERSWAQTFKNIGGQETITLRYAVPAGRDAVVAVSEFKIVGDGQNSGKTISGRAVITLTNTPDGWQYVAIVPQTQPPPASGTTGSRQ